MVQKLFQTLEGIFLLSHFFYFRYFASRHSRESLKIIQKKKLTRFLKKLSTRSKFYRGFGSNLKSYPIMDKSLFLENFTLLNAKGITLPEATSIALRAERERNFRPLWKGISLGLSSGTSGTRHVFLVSRLERLRWAGQIFAKVLKHRHLIQIALPWRSPLKIAFFLRANSNLYTTLSNPRIQFEYYDLTVSFEKLLEKLQGQLPHILVAPASVLCELAKRQDLQLKISPNLLVSVAEVLDKNSRDLIERKFNTKVSEIYQASEGFLGVSCSKGRVHLNEESLYVETEWLDHEKTRFHPIVTDFSRSSQDFVRYRLNDILKISDTACSCGLPTMSLDFIEGREEDVLWAMDKERRTRPIFPDRIRQAIYSIPDTLSDFKIIQKKNIWSVQVKSNEKIEFDEVQKALVQLLESENWVLPEFLKEDWVDSRWSEKPRRIQCLEKTL